MTIYELNNGLQARLGNLYSTEIIKVTKNNLVDVPAVKIKKANCLIQPIIYLENFEDMPYDIALDTAMEAIRAAFTSEQAEEMMSSVLGISNYENIKNTLFLQLLSTARNQEFLKDTPNKELAPGLSVIVRAKVPGIADRLASFVVKNGHIENYGITAEQLFEDAYNATLESDPDDESTICEMITKMGIGELVEDEVETFINLQTERPDLIVTNDDGLYGAGLIAYPGALKKYAQKMGGNYYMLPSSVNEVILVKEDYVEDPGRLSEMVREVNETVVVQEEILADNAYYYDAESDTLRMVA